MSNQPRRRGPMGGGHGRMGTGEKAKDFKGTMKKLFTYLSEYKIGIFFVMIFAIGSTVFNIIGPKVLGKATTEIFKGLVGKVSGGSGIDFTKIGKILLTLLCLYVISACFSFIQGYIMTGVSQKLTYRMRKEISEKINRMPMNYFDTTTHGEVLSRVTNDVDTLSQSLNQSATQMITSVTTIIGVLIMMISISPLMTVIALLILPVSMVLISVIVKHSQKYFKSQQEYLGHINGQVEEVYGGHNIVKAFNKEEDQFAENPVSVEGLQGNVEFEHVHFGYNPEHIIINDFSAKVKEGQKIAIVGPTGAGKTTMIKLLMRFYDVNSGAIKIDGHNIKDFNRSELRQMFGMVLQDTWLFSGSIEDNIKYGKLDATHEEVVAAAKAAHVHRFVQTLPSGYNMILNEEASNVSQGQKQLLTIARAILADPKILILDEATSSVDTRTEVQIQKAMDNLMKGRTSFVIAHRLSTIRDADLILVMKDGDIIEQGNHEELLEKNGFYAELYNSQFENATSCA